jgi:hypothetical protein
MGDERILRLPCTRSRRNQISKLVTFDPNPGIASKLTTDLIGYGPFKRGRGRTTEERLDNFKNLLAVQGDLSFTVVFFGSSYQTCSRASDSNQSRITRRDQSSSPDRIKYFFLRCAIVPFSVPRRVLD